MLVLQAGVDAHCKVVRNPFTLLLESTLNELYLPLAQNKYKCMSTYRLSASAFEAKQCAHANLGQV